ncbi:MAG: hypothetical protein ACT4OP_09900 [Actinomycetota bacterium]
MAEQPDIEIVELDAESDDRLRARPGNPRRPRALILTVLALVLMTGLALIPTSEPDNAPPEDETLRRPEEATTTTARPQSRVAVVGEERFALMRASGLDGYVSFAGPVEFQGRHWMAANPPRPTDRVVILSSEDGTAWITESEILAGTGRAVRIDDLVVWGEGLTAAGTIGSETGKSYFRVMPGCLALWRSVDGRQWTPATVRDDTGDTEYHNIRLAVSDRIGLLTAYTTRALDPGYLDLIPPQLEPALTTGDLALWVYDRGLEIVSPPGVKVWSTDIRYTDNSTQLLLRSDDIAMQWTELTETSGRIAVLPNGRFVKTSWSAGHQETTISTLGLGWWADDRVPNAVYSSAGPNLIGISTASPARYYLNDGERIVLVEATADVPAGDIRAGPDGFAALTATYPGPQPIIVESGDLKLRTADGGLRVDDGDGLRSYISMTGVGSYDAATDSVTITSQEERTFTFPLADLVKFWREPKPRTDVFVSADGYTWAKSYSGLIANFVTLIGQAGDTFLLGVNYQSGQVEQPTMTVLRTDPVG